MDPRYRIEVKDAGQGGFGRVDKAWDSALERWVAIKTLDPIFRNATPEDRERFSREAKALASFTHTNIPAVYDVVLPNDESEFRILFQWVEGITLREYLKERGVLNLEQVRTWFGNICSGLGHAHSKQIIHRDLKPSNLIVTGDLESCYLVDFGIALRTCDIQRLTLGTPIGTPGYMSPEQERGEELTAASDLFSLGIILYECLVGSKPTIGRYVPINSINEAIPSTIDDLVRHCLLDKNTRIQSTVEFIDKLRSALRPRVNFSSVLSQGSLADIHVHLTKMTPEDFNNLPLGQQNLIISRLRDIIRVGDHHMRNPVASLLAEMVRLGHAASDKNYKFIVENSLNYGYELQYSEQWQGNISIRNILNDVSIVCHAPSYNVLASIVLDMWKDIDRASEKESWYVHDLRILLQNLLANSQCTGDIAEKLVEKLDRLNELTHLPRSVGS